MLLKCTRTAVRISLGNVLKPAESVQLQAYEVPAMQKGNVLRELLYNESGKTLIFARTKRGTERLAKDLMRDGFAASMIHGDRTQSQRSAALAGFEAGRFQVLVATDVAARGIHVGDVAHVVNYDLPAIAEDFIHRVGRTGRAGLSGLRHHDCERRRDDRIAPLRAHAQTADRAQGTGQDAVHNSAEHADSDHPCSQEYEHLEVAHAEQPAGRDLRVSIVVTKMPEAAASGIFCFRHGCRILSVQRPALDYCTLSMRRCFPLTNSPDARGRS